MAAAFGGVVAGLGEWPGAALGEWAGAGLGECTGTGLGEWAGAGLGEWTGAGLETGLGGGPADPHPPNAVPAPASAPADESSAKVLPSWLNQMAAFRRGNWDAIAPAASTIHCPLVTPAGSPATGSALAHSASIIGLLESPATRV